MSARKEAAAAALHLARQKATFQVVGRPLVRNGRKLKPGTRISLTQADADILLGRGRVEPATRKAKPADPDAGR